MNRKLVPDQRPIAREDESGGRMAEPASTFAAFRSIGRNDMDEAHKAVARRAMRSQFISDTFCDGPAWNILIALQAEGRGAVLPLSEAKRQSFAPPLTAGRVLDLLIREGFLKSEPQPGEEGVRLSADGAKRLSAYFAACERAGL